MFSLLLTIGRFIRTLWLGLKEPEFRALFVLVAILILAGTIFYTHTEHWSVIDALYFCVTTLTTLGSSTVQPQTDVSKIFTMIYIFVGLGSVAAFITAVATRVEQQRPKIGKRKIK